MSVLVVDDDDATADAICELLEAEGYEVVCVADGKAALDRLRSDDVCLVLLDLMMPVMSGYEFREKQLESAELARVPVVVVTADPSPSERARQLRADGFLPKPVSPTELIRVTKKFCGSEDAMPPDAPAA
jgi:CheY-like chemotaxis protein